MKRSNKNIMKTDRKLTQSYPDFQDLLLDNALKI